MSKKPTLFALMVGIDKYKPGTNVPKLKGCQNDILEIKEILEKKYSGEFEMQDEKGNPTLISLINEAATYRKIIDSFEKFSDREDMKADDIFLFLFSGHGSRERQAKKFDRLYPEGWNESLVCYDSREEDGLDLADKELAVLFYNIGKKCSNITAILDCCHSGSSVRGDIDDQEGATRKLDERRDKEGKIKRRRYEDYLSGYYSERYPPDEEVKIKIPETRMISMAACLKREKARELAAYRRGAFSYFLGKTLEEHESISYNELIECVRGNIRSKLSSQTPLLEPYKMFNPNASFLTNKDLGEANYKVSVNTKGKWELNFGAQRGLPTHCKGPINLELFDEDISVGYATVETISLERSEVGLDFTPARNKKQYNARFLTPPVPPILILRKDLDEVGKKHLDDALDRRKPVHFKLLTHLVLPKYSLIVGKEENNNGQAISVEIRNVSKNSMIVRYVGDDYESIFKHAFDALEIIANWEKKLAIDNPNKPILNREEIEIIFKDKRTEREYTGEYIVLETVLKNGGYEPIPFEIIARNNLDSHQPLGFSPIYFSSYFQVTQEDWGSIDIPGGEEATLIENILGIPKMAVETTDIFKVFISTDNFNSSLLAQECFKGFGKIVYCNKRRGHLRGEETKKDLDGFQPPEMEIHDWLTKTIRVCTIGKIDTIDTPMV